MTRLTAVRPLARTRFYLFGALWLTLFCLSGVRFAAAAGPETGRQPVVVPAVPVDVAPVAPERSGEGAGILASCKASPSDANCNGKDPDATGCNADSTTIESLDIYGVYTGSGVPAGIVGKVVLRYSPLCKSMWARTTGYSGFGVTQVTSTLYRADGLYAFKTITAAGTVNSPMLYAVGSGRSVSTQGQVYFSLGGYGVTFGNYYYIQ